MKKVFRNMMLLFVITSLTLGCEKEYIIAVPDDSTNTNQIPNGNNGQNGSTDTSGTDTTGTNGSNEDTTEDNQVSPPPDAAWPYEHIHNITPPAGFEAVMPWAQAVHDVRQGNGQSMVEVNYLRLWAVVNGSNQLVCEDTYDTFDQASMWFGLYSRNPWFGTDDHLQMPVTYTSEGWLRFFPNTYPDKVWHWWDTQYPRAYVPAGTQRLWVEMNVKITGPALVQIGADFYRTPTAEANQQNVVEMGVSNWYGESANWQTIILGIPGN